MHKAAGLITTLFLLSGCQTLMTEQPNLEDSHWTAVTIDGQPIASDTPPTLTVLDNAVGGTTGCNSYSAQTRFGDDELEIGNAVSTRRACNPVLMDQERRFLEALQSSRGYRVAGNELYLLDTEGRERLKLIRAENITRQRQQ